MSVELDPSELAFKRMSAYIPCQTMPLEGLTTVCSLANTT